jgi:cytochrome c-type biogenesis protein CcmE
MKKIHIILLVLIAGAIAVLVSFLQTTTTYDTVATAKAKPGKFVHLMANPNYLTFTAIDSLGEKINVVYHNPKPENFELSEKLVMKGKYEDGKFVCQSIQTKCPSKYKDQDASKHPGNTDTKTSYNNIEQAITSKQ